MTWNDGCEQCRYQIGTYRDLVLSSASSSLYVWFRMSIWNQVYEVFDQVMDEGAARYDDWTSDPERVKKLIVWDSLGRGGLHEYRNGVVAS